MIYPEEMNNTKPNIVWSFSKERKFPILSIYPIHDATNYYSELDEFIIISFS